MSLHCLTQPLSMSDPTDTCGDKSVFHKTSHALASSQSQMASFCMLLFVYKPPFSGSPHPHQSLFLSPATSVHKCRGWLLPNWLTKGESVSRMAPMDISATKLCNINRNAECADHTRHIMISPASYVEPVSISPEKENQRRRYKEN